jgi:hypothetical protein
MLSIKVINSRELRPSFGERGHANRDVSSTESRPQSTSRGTKLGCRGLRRNNDDERMAAVETSDGRLHSALQQLPGALDWIRCDYDAARTGIVFGASGLNGLEELKVSVHPHALALKALIA